VMFFEKWRKTKPQPRHTLHCKHRSLSVTGNWFKDFEGDVPRVGDLINIPDSDLDFVVELVCWFVIDSAHAHVHIRPKMEETK